MHGTPKNSLLSEGRPAYTRVALLSDVAKIKPQYFLWMFVFCSDWLLLVIAMTLIEPVMATVISEFWPALFGLWTLTPYWRNKMLGGKRGESSTLGMLLLLIIGGVGVSLVLLSDTGTIDLLDFAIVGGVLIAFMSAFFGVLGASIELIASEDRRKTDVGSHSICVDDRATVSLSLTVSIRIVLSPILFLVSLFVAFFGSSNWWSVNGFGFAVLSGVVHVFANYCFVRANHLSRDAHRETMAKINALCYLIPIGALLLLLAFADPTIEHFDLLVLGVAIVMVSNVALHRAGARADTRS